MPSTPMELVSSSPSSWSRRVQLLRPFPPGRAGRAAHARNSILFHCFPPIKTLREWDQTSLFRIHKTPAASPRRRFQVLSHAGAQVLVDQLPGKAVQGASGGGGLHQDIRAVHVLFHHAPDAPDLALDAVQPGDEVLVFLLGALLVAAAAAGASLSRGTAGCFCRGGGAVGAAAPGSCSHRSCLFSFRYPLGVSYSIAAL